MSSRRKLVNVYIIFPFSDGIIENSMNKIIESAGKEHWPLAVERSSSEGAFLLEDPDQDQ